MSAAAIVELVLVLVVFVGLPILCWVDPAGHLEAERKRRAAQ